MLERSDSTWMQTFTGKAFHPLDPMPEEIDIRDIAHALAHTCRFGGHVNRFYSVAQHSIYVGCFCSEANALWGLLHDASEAYIQDIPRPLKPHLANYTEIEEGIMRAVATKFNLVWPMPAEIKAIDGRILINEKAALLGPAPRPWVLHGDALPGLKIEYWEHVDAEMAFLQAFSAFTGGNYGVE